MIRLLLVDDHQLFLEGLKLILSYAKELHVVATATDGDSAWQLMQEKTPDVVLMDLHMPGLSGYELCREAKANGCASKIIIVSMADEPSLIDKLFHCGADAYVLKNAGGEELMNAIYSVAKNERYISTEIQQKYAYKIPAVQPSKIIDGVLTKREIEILQYVIKGYTNPEIAEMLFLSTPTVQTHRKNIQAKLGLKNTASLVKYGMENKLLLGLK